MQINQSGIWFIQSVGGLISLMKHCFNSSPGMDLQFEKFVQFCEGHLDSSSVKLLDLVKKRYNECDREYKESHEFLEYILCTEAKISSDRSRFFVHLRDFLNILKENKAEVEEDSNCPVINGIKRFHESSESESDATSSLKRRRIEENERENESEQSSEDDSSDQEIDNTENVCEDGVQLKHESDNETCQSDSLAVEGDEITEDQDEKNVHVGKFEATVNLADCNKVVETTIEDQAVETLKNIHVEPNNFNDSQSEESEILTIIPSRPDSKELKTMFSSSEDEDSEEDTQTAINIKNIIRRHEDKKEDYDNHEEKQVCLIDEEENDCEQKCFQSPQTTDLIPSETVRNTHDDDEAECNETESILNTSGESVVILEESGEDDQHEQTKMRDNKNICSENLETKTNLKCADNKEIVNQKTLSVPEKTKCEKVDLNSSEEVTIIEPDSDEDRSDDALMAEKTQAFGDDSDTPHCNGDAEGKVSISTKDDFSTDEEDPSYAAKARKFREKCKKRYVVSVGKKKRHGHSSHSKDHIVPPVTIKCEKDRSPGKKRTPHNSPKCKKKSSPKKSSPRKSPIIIMTESESGSDEDDIEGFKKKFNEKVNTKFRKQFQIKDEPSVVVAKIPVKFEPMEVVNDQLDVNDESSRESSKPAVNVGSCNADDMISTDKENIFDDKTPIGAYDSASKKSESNKEGKEKTRVSFITEEIYNRKPDSEFDNLRKQHKAESDTAKFKDKHKHKSEKISPKVKAKTKHDHEEPGPSSALDDENMKKKGSSKQIRRLEALLENIRNQIEKVRTRDLDLDDMDSEISDYILEDKLQRKFMKVWDKLCELHKAIKSTGRPTDKYFRYQGTRYPEINRKLEKFVNKRKVFPDYHDIRSIVIKVNKDKRLHLRSREIDDLSREAFTDVGNQLQRRRQKDFVATFHTPGAEVNPFSLYDDPALYDPDLKKKLDANKKSAKSNMDKVVEKYAALQYQVGDKTDDDEDEEEEEEENDTNTGIDDLDQQLSGVDNSDSDNNTIPDFSVGRKTFETGPCLEIENLESGKKSTFSNDNPDDVDKLSPMKSRVKREREDWSPKHAHFSDQLGLCPTTSKTGLNDTSVTVTILSDNDDDNEVKCFNDEEKDDLDEISDKQSTSMSDNKLEESVDLTESNGTQCCSTADKAGIEKEIDVKNVSKVVNQTSVTVITDDEEDEEGNVSDQPLGLKIVSACHVSLDDLSSLHAEGEFDVAEELTKSSHEEQSVSKDLNHLSNTKAPLVKSDLGLGKEIGPKIVVLEDDEKQASAVKSKPFEGEDETAKAKLNEPEVMIIEDIDTEQVPASEKGSNSASQTLEKFTWKTEVMPDCTVRQGSSFRHTNTEVDGGTKVKVPLKTISHKINDVSECVVRQGSSFRHTNTKLDGGSKVPLKTHSFESSDVVIIDCEDSKESTTKTVKSVIKRLSCPAIPKLGSDVICIDTGPEIEIVSEVTKEVSHSAFRKNSNSVISKPEVKRRVTTKDVYLTSKENKTNSDEVISVDEEHYSLSTGKLVEVDNTTKRTPKDEIKENGEKGATVEIKAGVVKGTSSPSFRKEAKSPEDIFGGSSGRVEAGSPEDIFAGSYGTVESNECGSIEFCDDSEVFEIAEQSVKKHKLHNDFLKKELSVEAENSGKGTDDTVSSNVGESQNGEQDVTLTNLSEFTEKEKSKIVSSDQLNMESELKRKKSLILNGASKLTGEESVASTDEAEVFTAVKLQTVLMDEKDNSGCDESAREDIDHSESDPEMETDKTFVETEERASENSVALDYEDMQAMEDGESNSEISFGPDMNLSVNSAVQAGIVSASEDEQEVTGGFEDEDKISSTSCETENASSAVVKLKNPDIRNKLLQLKEAIINSKPLLEIKSQVKTQELTSQVTGCLQNAHWIERDENASLIETYQEPDSTPYNLEENMISSSSSEKIIVLSDSE